MSAVDYVSMGLPEEPVSAFHWQRKPEAPKVLTPAEQKRQAHNADMLARYHQKAKAAKVRNNQASHFNVELPERGRDVERRIQGASNRFKTA